MRRSLSRKNLWEQAPPFVRQTLGRAIGTIPPAFLLGRRFRREVGFLREAEWWSAERAREYQLEQLRSICTLAWKRSPYYRTSFDAAGFRPADLRSLDDLATLPRIDKETVRDNLERMMVVPSTARHLDYVSTGGSTGTTLRFYIGKERSAIEYAYLVAGWQRVGYSLGMPMAVVRGRVISRGRRYEYDPLLRHHYYSNFHMTDENMRWYLQHMTGLGQFFLHCYPSSGFLFSTLCARDGIAWPHNLRAVLVESEMVYGEQREAIERASGARLFSSYGHCEKLVCAAACEHSNLYHVWPTYGYCELVDEEGVSITTVGKAGEIAGTGFINRVTPFIRYRTGDWATYAGERCDACGREHMLLSHIEGRWPRGALVAKDGSLIVMTALNLHDDTFDRVRQYQFFQDTPGEAELRIVPLGSIDATTLERIRHRLESKLSGRARISVKMVDAIQLTASGKFNLIDQRIKEREELNHIGQSGR